VVSAAGWAQRAQAAPARCAASTSPRPSLTPPLAPARRSEEKDWELQHLATSALRELTLLLELAAKAGSAADRRAADRLARRLLHDDLRDSGLLPVLGRMIRGYSPKWGAQRGLPGCCSACCLVLPAALCSCCLVLLPAACCLLPAACCCTCCSWEHASCCECRADRLPSRPRRYSPRSQGAALVELVHVVAKLYDRLAAGGFVVRKRAARRARPRAKTPPAGGWALGQGLGAACCGERAL
jgi:hypothetical protein